MNNYELYDVTPPVSPSIIDEALIQRIENKAKLVRAETIRLISIAKTGHYASTFSCAEILASLYYGVLSLQYGKPDWEHRDRFVIGKGHAAVGLYPLLADWGFLEKSLLDDYTRLGNPLGDHPDMTTVPGVDFSSGTLGHALSTGMGMAIGSRILNDPFHVFVLLGDGELHEGQIWEAAMGASHHQLSNLIAIVDRNGFSLDGRVNDIINLDPLAERWKAFGWQVYEVDGHDVTAVTQLLVELKRRPANDKPSVVIAHTIKGKGIKHMENEFGWHLGWLDAIDEEKAYRELENETK